MDDSLRSKKHRQTAQESKKCKGSHLVNLNWIFTGKGSPFLPDFEIKYEFDQDSQRIMEMIYLMEHCPQVRYDMLKNFSELKDTKEEMIKKYLPTKKNKE